VEAVKGLLKLVHDLTLKRFKGGAYFKVKLPPGVEIGGLYHLGDGVFVGQLAPEVIKNTCGPVDEKARLAHPPHFLQVALNEIEPPEIIAYELIDNPIPSPREASLVRVKPVLTVMVRDPETGESVLRVCKDGEPFPIQPPRLH
jgi:hypothetical protein